MKGSIAQCAEELIRSKYGDAKWDQVCTTAGIPADTHFLPAADVDDAAVSAVLVAIGSVCGLSEAQVSEAYGEYWVCDYASRQYPAYFRGAHSARDLLLKMDTVHELVTRSVPGAQPPRFGYRWKDDNTLVIDYQSARRLTWLMVGLVKGVGIHYGEKLGVRTEANQVTVSFAAA